jgi:hypothetical protein
MRTIFLLAALLLGACGSSPQMIVASNYDQTCTVDADCSVIYVGEVCGCGCTHDAINMKDYARYLVDYRDRDCHPKVVCGVCASVSAYCNAGKCATKSP